LDTSMGMRYAMIALVSVCACAALYGTFRTMVFLLLKSKVGLVARIVWPALTLLLLLCIVDATRIEPYWIQITHHTLETTKLPPGARVRIVQLADIHMAGMGAREIQMLSRTAFERPDVIVLTGDHTIDKSPETMRMLTQVAQRLRRVAPTYAIDGNWDIPDDMAALRQGGVAQLQGWTAVRGTNGEQIALGETTWLSPSIAMPCPRSMRESFQVLLCHMPDVFAEAVRQRIDLVLVGHTHGGQVRLPIFGALLPDRRLVGRYQAGLYAQGGSLLYVSRGIGMEGGGAPKVRFCCRPEIAVFDIVGVKR
jgi:uncharacterized protein